MAITPPPLLILSTPRSFSTVTGMMLGRHPQLWCAPELNLFLVESMDQWLRFAARAPFRMHDGLLRAVAQLWFGGQTGDTIRMARDWADSRSDRSTADVFREIARKVAPRVLIDKSPSAAASARSLERVLNGFPDARFLHLTRHPRGYCRSVLRMLGQDTAGDTHARWLGQLAAMPAQALKPGQPLQSREPDPQHSWTRIHGGILKLMEQVPAGRHIHIRGEDLLQEPGRVLARITNWLQVSTTPADIEAMQHPELSPFASVGPEGASTGGDPSFLENPVLRRPATPESLEGPLEWRRDGAGFSAETRALAARFGYR